ncbi:DinB family protein [Chloroflexota bacterium]
MEFQRLLLRVFERASEMLGMALDGLTKKDLDYQPNPDCNSIAWLTWHLTRVQDSAISSLTGKDQRWIAEKWYSKFSRNLDPNDRGVGHTAEDVSNFQSPDAKTLLDYHYAVLKQTKEYINKLSIAELGREIDNPRTPTVGLRLAAMMGDNIQHVGQIAYIRGMLKGRGWYSR